MIAYLDTQAVVWLCENRIQRLTAKAVRVIEASDLLISPMVLLELGYLNEIGRILRPPQVLFQQLATQVGLHVCDHPFPAVIEAALFEAWTRDPFDRVIVAQARSNGYSSLVTSDAGIRQNYAKAIW